MKRKTYMTKKAQLFLAFCKYNICIVCELNFVDVLLVEKRKKKNLLAAANATAVQLHMPKCGQIKTMNENDLSKKVNKYLYVTSPL